MSEHCWWPPTLRPGMTGNDLERIAYGAQELRAHHFVDGKCTNCGESQSPLHQVVDAEVAALDIQLTKQL